MQLVAEQRRQTRACRAANVNADGHWGTLYLLAGRLPCVWCVLHLLDAA